MSKFKAIDTYTESGNRDSVNRSAMTFNSPVVFLMLEWGEMYRQVNRGLENVKALYLNESDNVATALADIPDKTPHKAEDKQHRNGYRLNGEDPFWGYIWRDIQKNCPDTKVIDIINELKEYGMDIRLFFLTRKKYKIWMQRSGRNELLILEASR